MEKRLNLGKFVSLGCVLLACASLGGMLYYRNDFQIKLAQLNADQAKMQAELTELRSQAKVAARSASSTETASGASSEPNGPASDAKPKTAGKDKNPFQAMMEGFGKMMQSKEAQAGLVELTKGSIQNQFKDLFDLLGLDEKQRSEAGAVLSSMEMEQQTAGMAFFGGKSKEELVQLTNEMIQKRKDSEEKLKGVLGEGNFKNYKTYVDSKPEREQIAMLRGRLQNSGHPLSEEQEQQVLDSLFKERKDYPWALDYSNDKDWDPAKLEPKNMDVFITQQEAYDRHMESKLTGVLSPEQMTGFQSSMEQRRGMTKMGLGMLKAMLGGKNGQ